MSRARVLIAAGVAAGLLLNGPAKADTTYTEFKQGPTAETSTSPGKDSFNNHVTTDPATGQVTVLRANPTPGATDCAGSGAFGYLRVDAVGPADHVTVDYTNAVIDPYTWIEVLVRDASDPSNPTAAFLAPAAEKRGPVAELEGSINVPLSEPVAAGAPFTVDVGLLTASACPNVDGGTITFGGVTVG
jgi:hypothetical protein